MDQIGRDLGLALSSNGPGMSGEGCWQPCASVADVVRGADAVLIFTECQQFRSLLLAELAASILQPAWLFDARAVVARAGTPDRFPPLAGWRRMPAGLRACPSKSTRGWRRGKYLPQI